MLTVTCFGEVLWDIFPGQKKIGGAPLNVALRLQSFGINSYIISRIGNDDDGKELLQYLEKNKLNISNIQIDKHYKTGSVKVTLDENRSASYKIEYPVAWDKVEVEDRAVKTVKSSNAFIFGSLACRDMDSKNSLLKFLQFAKFKVLDVNLRKPFYSIDLLLELMNKSDFIKCNDDELNLICSSLNFNSKSIIEQITFLSQQSQTKHICVTKGENGAVLLYNDLFYNNKGYPVKVIDTVGAGDSFLAALISQLLKKIQPKQALSYACAIGALVAGKKGANPKLIQSEIINFLKQFSQNNS